MYIMFFLYFFMLVILLILLILNLLISEFYFNNKREKMTSFECGFDLFMISRLPFSIHFYLISILFLIFDVEIILLFPMINSVYMLNYFNWFFVSMILLMILYFGMEYELNTGVMKWIK